MTPSAPIPVIIIHQDPLVRACLATALADRPQFEVREAMQAASEIEETLARACDGVVIADQTAALLMASTAFQRRLISPTRPPIVVVSSCDREWELRGSLERRVRGYLCPGFEAQQLVDCVATVHRGSRYLCQRAAARLAESLSYEALTERETAVLRLVVHGLPNKTIGRDLVISVGTVKSHLKAAYAKLEVTSRTQAIAEAQRRGLLEPSRDPPAIRPGVGSVATTQTFASASWHASPAFSVAGELRAA